MLPWVMPDVPVDRPEPTPYSSGMEARVAVLENSVANIERSLTTIQANIERLNASISELKGTVSHLPTACRMVTAIIGGQVALAGLLLAAVRLFAHG